MLRWLVLQVLELKDGETGNFKSMTRMEVRLLVLCGCWCCVAVGAVWLLVLWQNATGERRVQVLSGGSRC